MDMMRNGLATLVSTSIDVLPILVFILVFQILILRRPIQNFRRLLAGIGFTIFGLGLFLVGLEQALFPLGRVMAQQLTDPEFISRTAGAVVGDWHSYAWVYIFAFAIGFATTIAEPALLAVAMKANETSGGAIGVWGLRVAVALGAATGVSLGCFRIITGLPLQWFILAGYSVVIFQTMRTPKLIIPLAYDSGGVTTSTVTVPIVTALGLGLAETVPGRSPLLDGFGLVAFTCLFPIIAVLTYAQITEHIERFSKARRRRREDRKTPMYEEES